MAISKGVMTQGEYDRSVFYRISCGCWFDEHDVTMEIEFDEEIGDMSLTLYRDLDWSSYRDSGHDIWWRFLDLWFRLRTAAMVMLTGKVRVEGGITLFDLDHVNAFMEAIAEGRNKIIRWKEENWLK